MLVAPVALLSTISDAHTRDKILRQERIALMPLPEVPNFGTSYVDFRSLAFIDRGAIDECKRTASMSDEGVARLQVQLIAFFTRKNLS